MNVLKPMATISGTSRKVASGFAVVSGFRQAQQPQSEPEAARLRLWWSGREFSGGSYPPVPIW